MGTYNDGYGGRSGKLFGQSHILKKGPKFKFLCYLQHWQYILHARWRYWLGNSKHWKATLVSITLFQHFLPFKIYQVQGIKKWRVVQVPILWEASVAHWTDSHIDGHRGLWRGQFFNNNHTKNSFKIRNVPWKGIRRPYPVWVIREDFPKQIKLKEQEESVKFEAGVSWCKTVQAIGLNNLLIFRDIGGL